jgi:hypothetical protein
MSDSDATFGNLIDFYLDSMAMLLLGLGISEPMTQRLRIAVAKGAEAEIGKLLASERRQETNWELEALTDRLTTLARLTALLDDESVERDILVQLIDSLVGFAELSEQVGRPSGAYNFYEEAYHIAALIDAPALGIAVKLRALSNPDRIDQFHGTIWRLAIERLRFACDVQDFWIEALDAIELALNCPVQHEGVQVDLCGQFKRQLARTSDTPIEELVAIFALQSPPSCIAPEKRIAACKAMLDAPISEHPSPEASQAMELLALLQAQAMFDDMRQHLTQRAQFDPHIGWYDVTLHHHRLDGAVPLGTSLIADRARTGRLLLDLAHEIGHAQALLGPIGIFQAACRSAIHYLELMLIDLAGSERPDSAGISALPSLPTGDRAAAFSQVQLQIATKAAIAQAVWTPWLEGVSMYIELLCDPKADENEISAVHASVRSLIDFDVPANPDEDWEAHAERFMNAAAAQFDDFYSAALHNESRNLHIGYFHDSHGPKGDVYALGYLVVRSLVARWESVLGRPIPPIKAMRLLLHATQFGTFDALPDPCDGSDQYYRKCQEHFLGWLNALAALPATAIEDFLTPIGSGDAGVLRIWDGPMLKRAGAEDQASSADRVAPLLKMQRLAIQLAGIDPDTTHPQEADHAGHISMLFEAYLQRNRLLPVGRDQARLLVQGRHAAVCPRTYVGAPPRNSADASTYGDLPRYAPRVWPLLGGEEDAARLRQLCGREGSARVLATRIIDLGGHPDSPVPVPRMSYICFFLGEEFARITPWGANVDISETHPSFTRVLRERVATPFLFHGEEGTLASVTFLADRLRKVAPETAAVREADALDAEGKAIETALAAASDAFAKGDRERFSLSYSKTMGEVGRRLALARVLHATGIGAPLPEEPELRTTGLAGLLFGGTNLAGVAAFGGER